MTGTRKTNVLVVAFCSVILALALFQFSENTTDPDLWGHILFGQNHLKTGILDKAEPYSWTAVGYPWINHEVLSEVALAAAHLAGGGLGVLLLKVAIGMLTFWIALRTGAQGLDWPTRGVAWALGAIAVVEISFGFAARPQIFTALAIAGLASVLREIHRGKTGWSWLLPPFFVLWINTHGGALAGIALMWLTVGATTVQFIAARFGKTMAWLDESATVQAVMHLWTLAVLSTFALFANPWGIDLVQWLIASVRWLRPEIEEWNRARLSWDHGTFFITAALTVAAFALSKKKRALWEIAFCGALMVLAFRSVRHTPLFCIAALALVPRHLADVLARFYSNMGHRHTPLAAKPQRALALVLFLLSGGILWATVTLHKENAFTMEVPRKRYPVEAIKFIQEHQVQGNLLVFFDWGEMALWELPKSPVSIDGRLDTCYSREFIAEHWKFFNGEKVDPKILDLQKADFALLPANLQGSFMLKDLPGWQAVYVDNLAVVLIRDRTRFPKLVSFQKPMVGPDSTVVGRAPFPERNPRWSVK